jgi:hypothetical protein
MYGLKNSHRMWEFVFNRKYSAALMFHQRYLKCKFQIEKDSPPQKKTAVFKKSAKRRPACVPTCIPTNCQQQ